MDKWFEIGVIVKPQGIAGELRVLPTTDDPQRFALLDEVCVRPKAPGTPAIGKQHRAKNADDETVRPGEVHTYKLTSCRQHKGLVLLKLAGINDRNAAEKLVGGVLVIPPEKAIPLDTDEYFIRDLVGLSVETENGLVLGEVADVFPTGANDVYVVRSPEGESFMIPAIKDVVLAVSLPEGKMTVRLIEGLQELKA